jgi:hypothetical protein
VHNERLDTATAEGQFEAQRARFKGQQPLVEFEGEDDNNDNAVVHRPEPGAARVKINAIRVLIYDLRQGHLIHVDVPGWLVRMMPEDGNGRFGFQGEEQFARHRITIGDIERHGYGLIVDGHNPNTRILIWSE